MTKTMATLQGDEGEEDAIPIAVSKPVKKDAMKLFVKLVHAAGCEQKALKALAGLVNAAETKKVGSDEEKQESESEKSGAEGADSLKEKKDKKKDKDKDKDKKKKKNKKKDKEGEKEDGGKAGKEKKTKKDKKKKKEKEKEKVKGNQEGASSKGQAKGEEPQHSGKRAHGDHQHKHNKATEQQASNAMKRAKSGSKSYHSSSQGGQMTTNTYWDNAKLEGDGARKAKFLRLLGGAKSKSASQGNSSSSHPTRAVDVNKGAPIQPFCHLFPSSSCDSIIFIKFV